jgi:hypothetical protein
MRRRAAPPQLGTVHHIVLQQRKGVQQLDPGRCPQRGVVGLGATQPTEEHEGGAQTGAPHLEVVSDMAVQRGRRHRVERRRKQPPVDTAHLRPFQPVQPGIPRAYWCLS